MMQFNYVARARSPAEAILRAAARRGSRYLGGGTNLST